MHFSWQKSYLVGGWPTPLKNMKVSWDDDIPKWKKKEMFQTTNQLYISFVDDLDIIII